MIDNEIKGECNWKKNINKWIKTKQIDIKKSRTKSKENKLEGLIWKYGGPNTIFKEEREEKN